jgi:hypothetical protein
VYRERQRSVSAGNDIRYRLQPKLGTGRNRFELASAVEHEGTWSLGNFFRTESWHKQCHAEALCEGFGEAGHKRNFRGVERRPPPGPIKPRTAPKHRINDERRR